MINEAKKIKPVLIVSLIIGTFAGALMTNLALSAAKTNNINYMLAIPIVLIVMFGLLYIIKNVIFKNKQ